MKPYGIECKDVWDLEWWAGSPSKTGNKTKSRKKRRARRVCKHCARTIAKRLLKKSEHENVIG